jgi:HEAT repeat protein
MLRERLLGAPEGRRPEDLVRVLRWGTEELRARALRAFAIQRAGERDLRSALADPSQGVRRAAIWGLGVLGVPVAAQDATEETTLAVVVANARAAAPGRTDVPTFEALDALDARLLWTVAGLRSPVATPPRPALRDRARLALGAPPAPLAALRALRAADPQALAALGHPEDLPGLLAAFRTAGRRGEHTLLLALGLSGDPRALPELYRALTAIDVDPGRGFTQRRLAAVGLGRLGFRVATRWLLRALQDEARDFEGRPGAGLGIQYPVRTDLLWALGELADPAAIPALIDHLSDRQGSAFGGFYLPAMDALRKIGPPAAPALTQIVASGAEDAAAHALSVLTTLGVDPRPWRADPRATVRAMVEALVEGSPSR